MKKIVLVANRDFVLYNFRFELIERIIESGYEAVIMLPYGPKVDLMVAAGAKFVPLDVDGRGMNPFRDLSLFKSMTAAFKAEKPDVILLFTTKVCIYGGMAAGKLGIPYIVNVSGLGTAMGKKGILRNVLLRSFKKVVESAECVFFQNKHNMLFFHDHGIWAKKEILIPGSGVNCNRWKYLEYPDEKNGIHMLFIARIIKEKGIEDFLSVARKIHSERDDVYFHVVGPCDGNYQRILDKLVSDGTIIYHGMVDDTAGLLEKAHCLIHPSYYPEGISNVCLEAAASGRPVITTNNPGCAETVEDGTTGFVFQSKDNDQLTNAVKRFLSLSNEQKKDMGIKGRKRIKELYARDLVTDAYLKEISFI